MQLVMPLDSEQEYSIRTLIEDSVEHLCEQEVLSGELVWTTIAALAEAKRLEYQGIYPMSSLDTDAWLKDNVFDR
jgi:hypothetical protein